MQRTPTEQELVSDIFSCIAHGAIREGFTAEEVFEIINNSSAEEIFEYYMDYDPDLLLENVNVSDEFISEQIEILNEGWGAALRGLGGLFSKTTKRFFGPGTRRLVKDTGVKLKDTGVKLKDKVIKPGVDKVVKPLVRNTVNTALKVAPAAAVGYGLYKGGEKIADTIKDINNNNNNKNDTAPSAPQGGTAADKGGIEASGETKAIEPPKSVEPKSERKKRSGFRRSAMDLSGGLTKVQRNNRRIGR